MLGGIELTLRKSIIFFFPQEVHPIRLPTFWVCDCGRPNYSTPCSCGLRKIRQSPAARLRTWGLFPVPWAALFGPLFETNVADALEDEARRALVKELGEAGLVVIDEGKIYLPNLQTLVEEEIFNFNSRSMLKVLKAALYTNYRYAGNFFFRCPACVTHTSDDASSHHKRCDNRAAFPAIKAAAGRRHILLKAAALPPQDHELRIPLARFLTYIGGLLYANGALQTPLAYYGVTFQEFEM